MAELITKRLREKNFVCKMVGLGITYSKTIGGGFYHERKLDNYTDKTKTINEMCLNILNNYIKDLPIRKVSITLGKIKLKESEQLDIFNEYEINNLEHTIDEINDKFGGNTLLKASSLLDYSTIKSRNKKIGGHNKE